MGVPVLNKISFLLILLSLGFFGKKEKVVVPRIQRAVVIENQAIIYTQPDFDSEQMMKLPNNKIIAISTKIYRPKNLFGSFHRIFINKPRKIRGYISEIDVLPQYKKAKDGYVLNKKYQKKEQALRQVKSGLLRSVKGKIVQEEVLEKLDEPEVLETSQEEVIQEEVQSSENLVRDEPVLEPSEKLAKEEEKSEEENKKPAEESMKDSENSEKPMKDSKSSGEPSKESSAVEQEGSSKNE